MKILTQYVNYTISQYVLSPNYILKEEIVKLLSSPSKKLSKFYLMENPNAIDYIYRNKILKCIVNNNNTHPIVMVNIRYNHKHIFYNAHPKNIRYLRKNDLLEKIKPYNTVGDNIWLVKKLLSSKQIYKFLHHNNRIIVKWLKQNLESNIKNISKLALSRNPSLFVKEFLQKNPQYIDFMGLSSNPSEWAFELLLKNPDKIIMSELSTNPQIFKAVKSNKYWKLLESKLYILDIFKKPIKDISENVKNIMSQYVLPPIYKIKKDFEELENGYVQYMKKNPAALKMHIKHSIGRDVRNPIFNISYYLKKFGTYDIFNKNCFVKYKYSGIRHPYIIKILRKNIDKINKKGIATNTSLWAIKKGFCKNKTRLDICYHCYDKHVYKKYFKNELFAKNKICWKCLLKKKSPKKIINKLKNNKIKPTKEFFKHLDFFESQYLINKTFIRKNLNI